MDQGISALSIASGAVVAEPRWSPGGTRLGWLEATDGRTRLVVAPADGTAPATPVGGDDLVLGGTGAYRGGQWCWIDDDRVAVVTRAGALATVALDGTAPPRTVVRDGRCAAPVADTAGRLLVSIGRDDAQDVGEVPVHGRFWPQRWSFADFGWDPATTPDGRFVAWHEWDLDAMSWTASRIVLVDRHEGVPRVVAGGGRESVGQPRYAPDGRWLAYVSDAPGWWNVHVARADGTGARVLLAEPHDHAEPAWGPGQRSFAWSPDSDAIALCRNEDGFARLVEVTLAGDVHELAKGWHHALDWSRAGIVAVRSGARTPPEVTVLDPVAGERRVVARGVAAGLEDGAREPEIVRWSSGGVTVTGLFFAPDRESGSPPPLFVDLHGGPTGQAAVRWDGWLRYFTSRGWAVLRPNPRGSTGSGRAFVQDWARSWGEADVADIAAGIRAVTASGACDPARVAVGGGSAGGLSALMVGVRHGDLVRAVVSEYGVTDLFDLLRTTHRFESRYLDEVVGVLPEDEAVFRDRSPVTHAAELRVPLLVLQGDEDEVVPAAQAQLLVDAVRAAGGTVEHHVYPGEGHGFAKIATIVDELERTLAFLERWVT